MPHITDKNSSFFDESCRSLGFGMYYLFWRFSVCCQAVHQAIDDCKQTYFKCLYWMVFAFVACFVSSAYICLYICCVLLGWLYEQHATGHSAQPFAAVAC